jgi:hypothetical protein
MTFCSYSSRIVVMMLKSELACNMWDNYPSISKLSMRHCILLKIDSTFIGHPHDIMFIHMSVFNVAATLSMFKNRLSFNAS